MSPGNVYLESGSAITNSNLALKIYAV
jgi:hypothetical protein